MTKNKRTKQLDSVFGANSKKIDKSDMKTRRQYAVMRDNGKYVGVSKIRGYNDNAKNNSRLYFLDKEKYSLSKNSGVDKKVYSRRADNKKPLRLEDTDIFDCLPSFKL